MDVILTFICGALFLHLQPLLARQSALPRNLAMNRILVNTWL